MLWSRNRFHGIVAATAGLSAVLVVAAAVAADAPFLDLRRQQPISGDARAGKALSTVCSACHGADGHGIAPTFPDLAGQSATYLYVQLKTFKDGQRKDLVMAPMAASLGDAEMRNLAAYYASLPSRQGPDAGSGSRGGVLFGKGDSSRGIPPCQGCHGPGGKGPGSNADVEAPPPRPPWSTIPRLRGQSGAYVAKALRDFRSGARGNTSNAAIMHGVAKTLDDADIQALATYLEVR